MNQKNLFPKPYLPPGSKGPAVAFLQRLLLAFELNPNIVADGDYGNETKAGVQALQSRLNKGGARLEVDGCCGPMTRQALKEQYDLDLNAIPLFDAEETVVPKEK